MTRLTTQLTFQIAGLRGPGLTAGDTAVLNAATVEATRAAGFATLAAATAFAPKMATGVMTWVYSDPANHPAVAGEVLPGGGTAVGGESIPNSGWYVKQASGSIWRAGDLDSQKSTTAAAGIVNLFDLTDTKVDGLLAGVSSSDGGMPWSVNADGTTDMAAARSPDAQFGKMASPRILIQLGDGTIAGELVPADIDGLISGIGDAQGLMPIATNDDGTTDILFDPFARFSGGALVSNDLIIEARPYALHRRHIWAVWKGGAFAGKQFKLTADDTADHSITGYDAATGYVGVQKRFGHRVEQLAVQATQANGAQVRLRSNRDILLNGDSFVQQTLLTKMTAAATDKARNWRFTGSGGSWLTSHIAALGGPRVPSTVGGVSTGAGGGVVPASQVGTNPLRSGGLSEAQVTATINNGAGGSGLVLTVTAVARGAVAAGQQLIVPSGALVTGAPYIVQPFGTGGTTGTGGAGTYLLTGTAVNQASTNMYLGAWTYPGDTMGLESTVILMDGGLDDAVDGTPAIIARIMAMDAILTPLGKRWYYVQSGVDRNYTPAQVTAKLARDADIAAAIGWHYIETYSGMRLAGSTVGPGGGEVWSSANYLDTIHPSDPAGQTALAAIIMTRVENDGN